MQPPSDGPQEGPQGGPQEPQNAGELDLLTIGLVVFFVSLILVVGALLILPAIV